MIQIAEREKSEIPQKYQGKKVYSFSRISTFHNCPFEFYLNYIKQLPKMQNCYGDIGGIVHDIIDKLQTKTITNNESVKEFKSNILRLDLIGRTFPTEKVRKNFIECICHCLENYKPIKAEKFEIEKELYTTIGLTDTLFLGYLDILYFYNNGIIEIQDYKTSTMFAVKDLTEKSRQLILYAYALAKDYNIKVTSLKFNMLKYCTISWQGAKKIRATTCLRNEIVKKISNELKKDYKKQGKSDIEIGFLLSESINNNEIPKEFQDKYIIEDCYLDIPFTKEAVRELFDYVDSTITDINSKDENNENDWQPCDIQKNSFYCSILCGQRNNCKYYEQYCNQNADDFKKSDKGKDFIDELLAKK